MWGIIITGCYAVIVGVAIWRAESTEGWLDWTWKTLLAVSIVALPIIFWDLIASYWTSSEDGPIDINAGWW
jgi:hypothetical protein